jgi:hypothetical protein
MTASAKRARSPTSYLGVCSMAVNITRASSNQGSSSPHALDRQSDDEYDRQRELGERDRCSRPRLERATSTAQSVGWIDARETSPARRQHAVSMESRRQGQTRRSSDGINHRGDCPSTEFRRLGRTIGQRRSSAPPALEHDALGEQRRLGTTGANRRSNGISRTRRGSRELDTRDVGAQRQHEVVAAIMASRVGAPSRRRQRIGVILIVRPASFSDTRGQLRFNDSRSRACPTVALGASQQSPGDRRSNA